MIIYYKFFTILLLLFSLHTAAKKPDIIISGKVSPSNGDTIHLSFKREFIYHNIGAENYTAVCDSTGFFSFRIKNATHPGGMVLYSNGDPQLLLKHYYVEAGDSIFISFLKGGKDYVKRYSGYGFEKFYCAEALEQRQNLAFRTITMTGSFSKDSIINRLARSIAWFERLEDTLLHMLDGYKHKLTPAMYQVFQSNIIGWNHKERCLMLSRVFTAATPNQKKELYMLFKSKVFTTARIQGSIYSEYYIEFLFRRTAMDLKFSDTSYTMRRLYHAIASQFAGVKRERLITSYLLRGNQGVASSEYEYCLRNALQKLKIPLYKKYISDQLKRSNKGTEAYNFSLPDPTGTLISLENFKGKVVLVDFWFTGCFSCIKLAATLENHVINNFADSAVTFVSICADKEKDKWLRSVRSGKYTGPRSVNLYTGGAGMDHPLVKYYNIQGCPSLLLIDKNGKIFSSTPPKDGARLTRLINDALQ